MKIEKDEYNKVLIARIEGRLDGENPSRFKKRIHPWLERNPNLILDCSKLTYLDSSGLGALLSCLRKAVSLGGDLRIAGLVPAARMVFDLTRTRNVFSIFETVEKAAASFQPVS